MKEYEVEIRRAVYVKVDANNVREALAHVRKEYPNWTIESAEAVEGEYEGDWEPRATQIRKWLEEHPEVASFVVIDDGDVPGFGERFVQTDGATGLTATDADRAIAILNSVEVAAA